MIAGPPVRHDRRAVGDGIHAYALIPDVREEPHASRSRPALLHQPERRARRLGRAGRTATSAIARQSHVTDWHRVERARSMFTLKIGLLRSSGWTRELRPLHALRLHWSRNPRRIGAEMACFSLIPREGKFFEEFVALAGELPQGGERTPGDAVGGAAPVAACRQPQVDGASLRLSVDARPAQTSQPDVRHAARSRGHLRARPLRSTMSWTRSTRPAASCGCTRSRRSGRARAN